MLFLGDTGRTHKSLKKYTDNLISIKKKSTSSPELQWPEFLLGFHYIGWLTESLSTRLNLISSPSSLPRGQTANPVIQTPNSLITRLILLVWPTLIMSHLARINNQVPPWTTNFNHSRNSKDLDPGKGVGSWGAGQRGGEESQVNFFISRV